MKTSIITLVYNHEDYVKEALASALVQSRRADEIIIVDDASTDASAQIVEGFIREHPGAGIRFVRNDRNLGVSGSFAKALAMAQGEALFMMAGDDVSDPGRLERSVAYLETHPSAMALVTNADIIDERSLPQGCLDNCAAATESVSLSLAGLRPGEYFLRGRSSCGATAAYRAELFRRFAPLRPGLYAEDDPCAFRAMLLGTCDFLPEPLIRWRRHSNNLSHGKGARRGPEMAAHFRKCEAMMDQMIDDAEVWVGNGGSPDLVAAALAGFRFQKAKWALWAVAHERGLPLVAACRGVRALAVNAPSATAFYGEVWRPVLRLFVPFVLQRALARLRPSR